eukprot:CAMPEP_0174710342 /NCGR_PEP_ID=MMETSP1094-20130205/12004_1 /TAXON_ID=156173 /ORGANISM="Chrysochromulina brevifilum, Strain UTEX LB 985" /LENGTH=151 /DNA_ID=CAMNT_0015909131 /DNA_START=77 /DNA_END=533 /DNA_ORIENTATION=+
MSLIESTRIERAGAITVKFATLAVLRAKAAAVQAAARERALALMLASVESGVDSPLHMHSDAPTHGTGAAQNPAASKLSEARLTTEELVATQAAAETRLAAKRAFLSESSQVARCHEVRAARLQQHYASLATWASTRDATVTTAAIFTSYI